MGVGVKMRCWRLTEHVTCTSRAREKARLGYQSRDSMKDCRVNNDGILQHIIMYVQSRVQGIAAACIECGRPFECPVEAG